MKKISFSNEKWKNELMQAYTFRYKETPDFKQEQDHITTALNYQHPEGFDNISLLVPKACTAGVKATLRCAFDDLGCPEIILVKKPEECSDGAVRYGECFEIVLWKNGVNIWRHYMEEANHRCYWHKRLGLEVPMAEKEIHELSVEVRKDDIVFSVDGISCELRTADLFDEFYIGVTACEGIVRLYDLKIEYKHS